MLCFERRFSKQNSAIRLKSIVLAPPKIFWLATSLVTIFQLCYDSENISLVALRIYRWFPLSFCAYFSRFILCILLR